MKNSILLLLLVAATALSSCSNDDDTQTPPFFQQENPLSGYLAAANFTDKITYIDDNNNYEMGYMFTPKVKGQLNALVINTPDIVTALRVTIWDVATQLPIRTESVNVTAANTNTTFPIPPVLLQKDKGYAITMNTSDYYCWKQPNQSAVDYPFMVGNISVDFALINMGPAQLYPTDGMAVNAYFGNVSFKFQRTL